MPSAAIYDCEGPRLSADERAFFRDADPWGFILFARHCESPDAVRAHCGELREAVGRADAPILIDQEGGRVARLASPHWREHQPMAVFGRLWRLDPARARAAARLNAWLLGRMVSDLGVTVDCIPLLDVPQPDAHEIIGDRALATHPDQIAALGRSVMEGLTAGGAQPVIKHVPGHGRALADSHEALPRVVAGKDDLRAVDFAPFRALKDAPMAMTAHVIYEAYDSDHPATTSQTVISEVIRGEIGFDGLLMSDDLKMKALAGPVGARARDAIAAGCDIALCCNFSLEEKIEAAKNTPELEGHAHMRAAAALGGAPREERDPDAAYEELSRLLKPALV
ncbi:MAG: beta-N-acetylhexosaminidase [Parvularculaceae bacterium]